MQSVKKSGALRTANRGCGKTNLRLILLCDSRVFYVNDELLLLVL